MKTEYLEGILGSVLEMGYASTWIILTVLLLRCISQRAPKKYSYMLWAIPAVRLLIPIPFAGIWGMLGGLPEGSLGRAFYQAAFFLSHPGEIGRLLAGDGAGGGMLGLTGNGGIWDKAVQAGSFIFSHALEVAGGGEALGMPARGGIGPGLAQGREGTLGNMPAQAGGVQAGSMLPQPGGVAFGNMLPQPNSAAAGSLQAAAEGNAEAPLMQLAAILWAMGILLYIGWNVSSYIRLKRKLQVAVRWEGNVYFADGISRPFALAGFPGRIYLPSGLSGGEAANILRHERVHVRRKDPWLNLLAAVILGVYWFHPLVWAGVRYFRRDMEMSCDEAAVAGLDAERVKGYIMDMLRFTISRDQWMQFPCGFGEKGVVERAMNLKNRKARAKGPLWVAGAVVAAAAIILIPNAQSIPRVGGAQELAGEGSGEERPGIGGTIQTIGAKKAKSSQEAILEAESQKAQDAGSQKAAGKSKEGQNAVKPEAAKTSQEGQDTRSPETAGISQEKQEGQSQQKPQSLQEFLEKYFTELYRTLSDDSIDFSHEDFASINGYIVAKGLIAERVRANIMNDRIHNMKICEVNLEDISEDGTEVEVYVKSEWNYGMTPKHKEGMGTGYRVSITSDENGYQVLDLEGDAKELIILKESIVLNSNSADGAETDYDAVDAFYGDYRVDDLRRMREEQDKK